MGALYPGRCPGNYIEIFPKPRLQGFDIHLVFGHAVIHAVLRQEIQKHIIRNRYISFKINGPYKLGHGDKKGQTAGKPQGKDLSFPHFPYKKRQPVSFQNGCPCSGLFYNRPQLVEIGQADIHGIAILLPGNVPQQNVVIAAQIHKPLRRISPYLYLQIPPQIPEKFLHAYYPSMVSKIADTLYISDYLHVLVGIIINDQPASADSDLSGFCLQYD